MKAYLTYILQLIQIFPIMFVIQRFISEDGEADR